MSTILTNQQASLQCRHENVMKKDEVKKSLLMLSMMCKKHHSSDSTKEKVYVKAYLTDCTVAYDDTLDTFVFHFAFLYNLIKLSIIWSELLRYYSD